MERATAAVSFDLARHDASPTFGTCEDTVDAFASQRAFAKAGAHAVKLEGVGAAAPHIIAGLVSTSIPLCAHLFPTPQSENTWAAPCRAEETTRRRVTP